MPVTVRIESTTRSSACERDPLIRTESPDWIIPATPLTQSVIQGAQLNDHQIDPGIDDRLGAMR